MPRRQYSLCSRIFTLGKSCSHRILNTTHEIQEIQSHRATDNSSNYVVDEYGKTPFLATAPMCIATTNNCDINISCLYLLYNKTERIAANYDGYFDEIDSGNSPAMLIIMLVSSWFTANNSRNYLLKASHCSNVPTCYSAVIPVGVLFCENRLKVKASRGFCLVRLRAPSYRLSAFEPFASGTLLHIT